MVFSYTITHEYLSGLGIANKNCEAGNISMVEFKAAKIDAGLPIFNYAVGYDLTNSEPLMYEKYPGSINDVSQLQFMVEKVKGYGYKNIGFIALIIRCKLYTALKDKIVEMVKKPNYLTVPAAIRELEKIEMTRQTDNVYRLDHAVTAKQKKILKAFGMNEGNITYRAGEISNILKKSNIQKERR